jgi:release factor glutamine methyltransferase
MLTVLQAIELSKKYLDEKGVKEARLNAELLLADILKMKRLELYLSYEKPLSEKEKTKYREYLRRRGEHEPLQYILGYTEFYGNKYIVNPSVLIPRPETELLVEKIAKENLSPDLIRVLDIGTGSGNIAISLKKELPTAEVTGVDKSDEALEVAELNCKKILGSEEVVFQQADIFDDDFPARFNGFDIVVSNPPYVSIEEFKTLDSEVKDFEPQSAVTDNSDGYNFYRRIAELANLLLLPKGKLYLEIGHSEAEGIVDMLRNSGLKNIEVTKDLAGIERIIKGERE